MDHRERFKPSGEIEEFEEEYNTTLPKHKIVCPTCMGKGTHVNPAIDSHGLTYEDFHDDPQFYEDYMAGNYDVTCYECKGRNVVDSIDEDRMDPELLKEWHKWLQEEAEYHAVCEMERRMGC